MAVLKNGKLVGRVGSLVYREVNGRTIVQSRPRPPKGGFKLTSRNSNFAIASKAASALYQELKDFALNLPTRELYTAMISLLMENPTALSSENGKGDWSLVSGSHSLPIEKRPNLSALLKDELVSEIADGKCRLMIPSVKWQDKKGVAHRLWRDVSEFELTYTVLHYDFETTSASVVEQWTSDRLPKAKVSEPLDLDCELIDWEGEPLSGGLIVVAAGVKLYASASSSAYLNRQDLNPFAISGMWKKF